MHVSQLPALVHGYVVGSTWVNLKEPELPPPRLAPGNSFPSRGLSEGRQEAELDQACSPGKAKHWGREKVEKQEAAIFFPS